MTTVNPNFAYHSALPEYTFHSISPEDNRRDKKLASVEWLPAPFPIAPETLEAFEFEIKNSSNVKVGHMTDGGTMYSDGRGNVFVEYPSPDQRKIYAAAGMGRLGIYETRPDGSWTETESFSDRAVIRRMNADGSGTQAINSREVILSTVWAPGGAFQEQIKINMRTGKRTVTKPRQDEELIPFSTFSLSFLRQGPRRDHALS
jgi:hypothetical protein